MDMSKEELIILLKSVTPTVNEGVTASKNIDTYPRIVFWDYVWEDVPASGEAYSTVETYQVSFYAEESRHKKLLLLRDKLREYKLFPIIYHEYLEEENVYHSYFSVEIHV